MDAELKAKWVTALRSGEYKQARGRLCREDGFCCLGVLCDVAGFTWVDTMEEMRVDRLTRMSRTRCTLPQDFRERVDLDDRAECDLIERNDDFKQSFAEIATFIEENL